MQTMKARRCKLLSGIPIGLNSILNGKTAGERFMFGPNWVILLHFISPTNRIFVSFENRKFFTFSQDLV